MGAQYFELDNWHDYESAVAEFETDIKMMFGENMEQLVKQCVFKDRGLFWLSYKYIPHNYTIKIENEFRGFSISIEDGEGSYTFLSEIKKHDSNLANSNIKRAIILLKDALQENDFDLYFTKDNKYYRKNKEGIKRVKNRWQEKK